MAEPRPRLHLGFFKLPDNADYKPRVRPDTGTGDPPTFTLSAPTGVAAPSYSYHGGQFLDEVFTFRETPLLGGHITDFSANLRLNVGCDWRFSWEYDVSNPGHVAIVEAATDTAAFVAWYIQTDDDDNDVVSLRGFMGGGVLDAIDVDNVPTISRQTVYAPGNHFVRRGMSGPVSTARASELANGTGLLEVAGTCWAAALNETPHQPIAKNIRQIGFPTVEPPDAYTAYSPMTAGTTSARQTAIRSWMAQLFSNNADLKDTAAWSSDFPTQLGKWLLRPAFTEAALTHMANLTANGELINYAYNPGPHSVLKTLQKIAARAGLVMHTAFPLIWFDVGLLPSSTANTEFSSADFSSSTLSFRRPSGTYFIIEHQDDVTKDRTLSPDLADGVIRVIRDEEDLVKTYGIIARTLQSTAPDRRLPREGEDVAISNADIKELLEEQAAEAAIRAFTNQDGDIETRWLASSRYGIDWNLGSIVRVYVGGLESDLLLVNSVAIRLDTTGDWSFRAGLGSTADLAPQIRHRIEASQTRNF